MARFAEVTGGRLDAISNKSRLFEEALLKTRFEITKLKNITKVIKTGTTPHNSLNPFADIGIPFLRNSNIQNTILVFDDLKYINCELKNQLTYSYKNEVIICIAGTVGDSAINHSDKPLAINQNVSSLSLKENVNISYLNEFLNSPLNKKLVKRVCSIATILYLNNTNLLNLLIPLPPLEKQNEIVKHIAAIREQAFDMREQAKAILQQTKSEIEEMIIG